MCAVARHNRRPIGPLATCLLSAVLLAGCRTAPPDEPSARAPVDVAPAALEPPPPGAAHYSVAPSLSDVRILVYRAGPLARFGHNHIVSAREARGDIYIAEELGRSSLVLRLPVHAMEVDPPSARAEEGAEFASEVSPEAIEATRANMLGPDVLDAENHPQITIRSVAIAGPRWRPDITVQVTLRGETAQYKLPAAVERTGRRVTATGAFDLRLTDFGLTPFAALGGGLRVQDRLSVRFRIVADRVGP